MAQTFLEQVKFIPSEFILNNAASTCFNDERVMSFDFAVTNVRVHVLYFLIFFTVYCSEQFLQSNDYI